MLATNKKFSKNKLNYLNSEEAKKKPEEALSMSNVLKVIEDYKKKYGIDNIIVSGRLSDENIQTLKDICLKLDGESTKYVTYFQWHHFLSPSTEIFGGKTISVKQFLNDDGRIKSSDFSVSDLSYLNSIILRLHDATTEKLAKLNKAIDKYKEKLTQYIENKHRRLKKDQVIQEVLKIQEQLDENKSIGYLFHYEAHFEALVIKKRHIIKLIEWPKVIKEKEKITSSDFQALYHPLASEGPQTGHFECAALCLLYLKKLLSNNEKQLKESTVFFRCYIKDNLRYIFVPSAETLSYSQNLFYNQETEAFMQNQSEEVEVVYKYNNRTSVKHIKPIKALLEDSIEIAKRKNDQAILKENQELLSKWPEFSKKWLLEYRLHARVRDEIFIQVDRRMKNVYLEYHAKKMNEMLNLFFKNTNEKNQQITLTYGSSSPSF